MKAHSELNMFSGPAGPPVVPAVAVHFVVPGPLTTPTGGFVYDRHMIGALAGCGRLASVIALPDRFPEPQPAVRARALAAIAALPAGAWVVVDGLALPALAPALASHHVIALVHHPVCDETGLDAAARDAWFVRERDALAGVRAVITTSAATARRLEAFGVAQTRVAVVAPGVDDTLRGSFGALRAGGHGVRTLLSVGSLMPRKGHDRLLRALARVRRLPWRLVVIGAARDGAYSRRLRRLACALGFRGRIAWRGVLGDRLRDRLYREADLLVHPAWHEGYGMVPVEAVAHGTPVLGFDIDAVREAVPATCRILVRPGDADALGRALERLIRDDALARTLRRNARRAARTLRRWSGAEAEFVAAVASAVTGTPYYDLEGKGRTWKLGTRSIAAWSARRP
jgi:glycosyltransferase involved in cell wall biosynthesis